MRAFIPALFALGSIASVSSATAQAVRLKPAEWPAVGRMEPRYQSYNVEMAEIIGARFWKPYAHMPPGATPPANARIGQDPSLFEARAPADLGNPRLRLLAAALGPAYVRISGTWANSVYFQNDDAPAMTAAPAGFSGVLTRAEWRGVLGFAKAVDAKLVTSFTISGGVRDPAGTWTAAEAQPLLDYTRSIGGEIYAAELFNEPNLAGSGAGGKGYDAAAFSRDIAAFRAFISQTAPGLKVVGPGDAVIANSAIPGSPTVEDMLAVQPPPLFEVFSYHFYPGVSQRCALASDPKLGTPQDQALSEAWLARTDTAFQAHKALRDRLAPGAPIWITETAQAACGGSPWAATFADTFRYLDQMGRLARQGAGAIFHNTLAASEYGLIDGPTVTPRPDYWAALLWRRQMGSIVLDAGRAPPEVHLYAHCLPDHPGGVALLALNLSARASTLTIDARAGTSYVLTATSLDSQTVMLNGQPLALTTDGKIPELRAQRVASDPMRLAPQSISFVRLPDAGNRSCR